MCVQGSGGVCACAACRRWCGEAMHMLTYMLAWALHESRLGGP
jgi:hypothetical protein